MSDGYNDAEFLVDLVTEADRQGYSMEIADKYAQSDHKARTDAELDAYMGEDHKLEMPEGE
jgi:hypothetical protein